MGSRRLAVVAIVSVLAFGGPVLSASARPNNCFVTATTVQQGASFTISGPGSLNGEHIVALLDSATQIGEGFTNATGSPITFSFVATIPGSTAAPANHHLQVRNDTAQVSACPDIFVTAAATATPSPTPSPAPTASPAPTTTTPIATFPAFIPITLLQQQQQQQQQGGGGGSPQQQQGRGSSGGSQQQQQQQQQQSPVIRDVGASILPRTGADAKRIGAWGAALLLVGLLLVGWSRRRRRAAQSRALAELPPIEAVIVEPDGSWEPGMPHPSEFLSEADGIPPVYLPWPERRYLPAPEDSDDSEDALTPSY